MAKNLLIVIVLYLFGMEGLKADFVIHGSNSERTVISAADIVKLRWKPELVFSFIVSKDVAMMQPNFLKINRGKYKVISSGELEEFDFNAGKKNDYKFIDVEFSNMKDLLQVVTLLTTDKLFSIETMEFKKLKEDDRIQ